MSKVTTETKVGLFVLGGLALLVYMSIRIGGLDIGGDKGYQIYSLFDNATGLKVKAPVQIAGITIGAVDAITLDHSRAKVSMTIDSNVALPIDSQIMIRTQGVLGDKFIEISPGTAGVPVIKPGGRVVKTVSPADIDQIITMVSQIAGDIRKVTSALSGAIGGEEGANQLRNIMRNFSEVSDNLARLTRDNNEQLNKMIKNLTAFSEDLKDMTSGNKENINAILVSFRKTSENMSQTIAALQNISEKINRGEGSLGALVNDNTTVRDLNATLASLKDIAGKINEGEGTIGKLINDSTTAERLDDALEGVNDYLTKENDFKVYVDYHGDYMLARDELKSTLNVRLQPSDDKYYLVGIVSENYGTYTKTDKKYTLDGQEYTATEENWERGELKFNAQIAKRYHDLVMRGGLIESGGGFGVDYFMLDDKLKFTFEGFSGDLDHAAHLRASVNYDFWKLFYLTAGYDDFISDQGRESAFIGLGLQFNDDDLKHVISKIPLPGN